MNGLFRNILASAAMLLCSVGAWGGGTVDIVQVLGTDGLEAGDLAVISCESTNAEGTAFKLTVTPFTPFYVSGATAILKISGDNAQSRRKSPQINPVIVVTPMDANADPSGTTIYTFETPSADYDVEVTISFMERTSIAQALVTLEEYAFVTDGTEKRPSVASVVVDNDVLDEKFYDVNYADNVKSGWGKVIVSGKRTYIGEAYATFSIAYLLTVNGIRVTPENMLDILGVQDDGDDGVADSTVAYNGAGTLILKNCDTDIKVESGLGIDLTVFLKGDNKLYSIRETTDTDPKLTITTDPSRPGTLVLGKTFSADHPVMGFSSAEIDNKCGLSWLKGDAAASYAEIGTFIEPIVEETTIAPREENFDTSAVTYETFTFSQVIENVLYTYEVDRNDEDNTNGFVSAAESGDGKPGIVLNTGVTEEDLEKALQSEPGTVDFADYFTGITFKIPAGTGKIIFDVFIGDVMMVKIGANPPIAIGATDGNELIEIPYVCAEACFVYVYNGSVYVGVRALAKQDIPQRAKIRPTTVKMHSFSVSPDAIQELSDPALEALPENKLNTVDVTNIVNGVFSLADGSVTSLADGIFKNMRVKSIDLSNTSITGVEVRRGDGPFEGVDDQAFIYMPVGNTAADGEINVVIGVVCDNMQLNDGDEEFAAVKDFGAVDVTLGRDFIEGQTSTVYLPFGMDQTTASSFGKFYTFDKINAQGEADLTRIETDLQANTPYIFIKTETGNLHLNSVMVKALPENPTVAELIGTYDKIEWTSELLDDCLSRQEYIYGYAAKDEGDIHAGEFVRVGAGASIAPYRAYLKIKKDAGARVKINWNDYENSETGISDNNRETIANNRYYNLQGQRVSNPVKGIYIVGGKKVVKN